jgi:hypothetical protein
MGIICKTSVPLSTADMKFFYFWAKKFITGGNTEFSGNEAAGAASHDAGSLRYARR